MAVGTNTPKTPNWHFDVLYYFHIFCHSCLGTTSQKHRVKHLGVCRLLKVFFAIFTNWLIQQQTKPANTTHPQHTTTTKMSRLCPTLGGSALSLHGHIKGNPNTWCRGTIWLHGWHNLCGLAALWSVPFLGGWNDNTSKNREVMVVWP